MTYQICELRGGAWDLTDPTEYPEPGLAIAMLAFKHGEMLCSTADEKGVFAVMRVRDGAQIACVRPMNEQPSAKLGQAPIYHPGPLRRWRGLTWVGWLNYLLLRWFLVRIVYTVEDDGTISRWKLGFYPRPWRW